MENRFLDPIVFSGVPYATTPLLIHENFTSTELSEDDDIENEEDLSELAPLPPMLQYLPTPVRSTDPDRQVDIQPPRWPIHPLPSPPREVESPPTEPSPPRSPLYSPSPGPPSPTTPLPATIETPPPPAPLRRSERSRRPTERQTESDAGAKLAFALALYTPYIPSYSSPVTPRTIREAMTSPYAVQ
jgi:hypothetical protein